MGKKLQNLYFRSMQVIDMQLKYGIHDVYEVKISKSTSFQKMLEHF